MTLLAAGLRVKALLPADAQACALVSQGSLNPMLQCVPSQNGLFFDPPQRQSV
jgi:hypothetical protein